MNTVPAFPLVATPEGDRGPRDAVEDMDGETSNAIGSVKRALTDARTANLTREVIALEAALSLLETVWFREERSECGHCEGSGVIPRGQFGSTVQRPGAYDFPINEPCDDCNGSGEVQPAEPVVTRIEFAAGHENERLTDEGVAAKLRLMKAAPKLLEAAQAAWNCIGELPPTQVAAGADSDIMPFDVSRFPLSAAFDDACAPEGAAPVTRYEDGIAELEGDPWIFWAVVAGVIGGMLLSVAFPSGFLP